MSEESGYWTTLPEAVARAGDYVKNFESSQQLSLNDTISLLSRNLSRRSVVSTTSSFAQQQKDAVEERALQTFRQIGLGSCGTVFAQTGTNRVYKLGRNTNSKIQEDCEMAIKIRKQFSKSNALFPDRVP